LDLVNLNIYDLKNTFFQFNIVEYKSNVKDESHLLNLKHYLDNYSEIIKPVILQDCYYLDKGDDIAKPILNKISNKTTQFLSKDEYLKPFEEILISLSNFFLEEERFYSLVDSTLFNYKY